jgi:hypothetical protein
VPEAQFEDAVKADKPLDRGIVAAAKPEPKRDAVDPLALWLWGRLIDFERQGLLAGAAGRPAPPKLSFAQDYAAEWIDHETS